MLVVFMPILYRWWLALYRLISLAFFLFKLRQHMPYRKANAAPSQKNLHIKQQQKPEWVRNEIIRLKAFMIHDGCRKIADTFNRLYADKRQMTVGKTFVYKTIQNHRYEIHTLRRKIRNKRPRVLPKNLIWSMDLTQVTDSQNQPHITLGIIDSGTRACLHLRNLPTKASIVLLRHLLDTIERYGKPKAVRTDNEAVFTSRLFRFGLWLLNIKHQRTEVCCPWMNGKIERLFGILKQRLTHYTIQGSETLATDLDTFRFWYNAVRPHQHLNGLTPVEAWQRCKPNTDSKPCEFSAWDGTLAGFYFPPP